MEEYLTLQRAAHVAGYASPSHLRTAARTGKLKTVVYGPHARLTTHAWLYEYLQTLRKGEYKRGQARAGADES